MPKGDSADLSEKISGDIAVKPPRAVRGKPFRKGVSANPGGRPATAAAFRAQSREAAATFQALIIALGQAGKLEFAELTLALDAAATRAGYLTDEKRVELDAVRLGALAAILGGEHLTEDQRTKILSDFQTRLLAVDTS
jgi:hypothetical protein